MEVAEVASGLYRWTARHPAAVPDAKPGSVDDWGPDVGSVAYLAPETLVVIDPLVPADEAGFWAWLDELAGRRQRVAVLTTLQFHRRSRDRVVDRYGGSTSRSKTALPAGVEPLPIRGAGETMFWIAEHGALVPGDRVLGANGGGLRICPESWIRYLPRRLSAEELRRRLQFLLELPVEMVLVSHGEPVLEGGHRALERALAA